MSFRLAQAALEFGTLSGTDFDFPDGIVELRAEQDATSVLECLGGLRPLQGGHYFWDEVDLYHTEARESLARRRRIGCAFDHRGLLFGISLFENLQLPLLYHRHLDEDGATERANAYLARMGLTGQAQLRPAQVSAAQRKLCVLARSLVTHPKLVVWHEPTHGLTREQSAPLAEWLAEHADRHGLQQAFVANEDSAFFKSLQTSTVTLVNGHLKGGRR